MSSKACTNRCNVTDGGACGTFPNARTSLHRRANPNVDSDPFSCAKAHIDSYCDANSLCDANAHCHSYHHAHTKA